jgi:hypothetical protein
MAKSNHDQLTMQHNPGAGVCEFIFRARPPALNGIVQV